MFDSFTVFAIELKS